MKIRTGWVSNSSSSSFVLYGFKVPSSQMKTLLDADEDTLYDKLEECGAENVFDYEADTVYIGKSIANWSDGIEVCQRAISLTELATAVESVKQRFGLTGEPKFYSGTRET
jgi:hypothetical protein